MTEIVTDISGTFPSLVVTAVVAGDISAHPPNYQDSAGGWNVLLWDSNVGSHNLLLGPRVILPEDGVVSVRGVLPEITISLGIAPKPEDVILTGVFPSLTVAAVAIYDFKVSRPLVGTSTSSWQIADTSGSGVKDFVQSPDRGVAGASIVLGSIYPLRVEISPIHQNAEGKHISAGFSSRNASPTNFKGVSSSWQNGLRSSRNIRLHHENAVRAKVNEVRLWSQDTLRDRGRGLTSWYQDGVSLGRGVASPFGKGSARRSLFGIWYQQASKPPAGTSPGYPVHPPKAPCYTPTGDITFEFTSNPEVELLFICASGIDTITVTKIIPSQEVYMIENSLVVTRVSDGVPIQCKAASFSIDKDSWVWGFTATVPSYEESKVMPSGQPVEINILCNTVNLRFLVEKVTRTRSFGSSSLAISGKGIAALLDSPYSPVVSGANAEERTAQQVLVEFLTDNGQSIGWSLGWGLNDWLMPAGSWVHSGSYISGVLALAQAAGAYVQADKSLKTLHIKPLYPVKPWDWGTEVVPDFEIPSDIAKTESVEWVSKPQYNAVYVSGETYGVNAYIKRVGTNGTPEAPSVVDRLLTEAPANLQRGVAILSDTGDMELITLSMPLLQNIGLITPGKFVKYRDGGIDRIGLVRSTSISASLPTITQTIGVEVHV